MYFNAMEIEDRAERRTRRMKNGTSLFKPLFGRDVLINAALFVLCRLPEKDRRLHKLFKLLWFADLDNLKKHGRTITGDTYVAMNYGPVPSVLYAEIKSPAPDDPCIRREDRPDGNGFLVVSREPDMDFLSETDVETLERSVDRHGNESFEKLTGESHGLSWKSAWNSGRNSTIRIGEMLDEIGADDELREYVANDGDVNALLSSLSSDARL